jgi:hypothetical protein
MYKSLNCINFVITKMLFMRYTVSSGHPVVYTVPKIWFIINLSFMYSQKWNCVALFPIPTSMHLWAIYILPESVCIFGCSKIDRPVLGLYKSLTDTWMWKLRDRTLQFCFGNSKAAHFHFWEYINWKQTFKLDSHRPFICSV